MLNLAVSLNILVVLFLMFCTSALTVRRNKASKIRSEAGLNSLGVADRVDQIPLCQCTTLHLQLKTR